MKKIRRMLGTFARKHLMGLYKIYEKFFWGIVEKRKKQGLHELGYIYVEKMCIYTQNTVYFLINQYKK